MRQTRDLALILILLLCMGLVLSQHDETVSPGARGVGVVEAVCSRIEASCVFSDDKLFTRRLAYVESYDGQRQDTFKPDYYGGIWQVDEVMFNATKTSTVLNQLKTQIQNITKAFGIDWSAVAWQDLTKPLYSALGARLYLLHKAGTNQIPRPISDQADYWVTYYRPGQNSSKFSTEAQKTEKVCSNVKGADIVFILDRSGSIGSVNFLQMKKFVKDVVKSFEIGLESSQSRIAVTTFSDYVLNEFNLKKYTTKQEVLNAVDKVVYYGGGTRTDLALDDLALNSFTTANGARPREAGHPRVGIVVTDGESNLQLLTLVAAKRVHNASITMFAVGVGSSLDLNELRAIASVPTCLHVLLLSNFQEFDSLKDAIEKRTCGAAIEIRPGEDDIDIEPGDGQNCKIIVPTEGITIRVEAKYGEISFFTSSTTYPSSDYFEKKISAKSGKLGVLYLPNSSANDGSIFCNLKALKSGKGGVGGLAGDWDMCKNKSCSNGEVCVQNKAGQTWCESETNRSTTTSTTSLWLLLVFLSTMVLLAFN